MPGEELEPRGLPTLQGQCLEITGFEPAVGYPHHYPRREEGRQFRLMTWLSAFSAVEVGWFTPDTGLTAGTITTRSLTAHGLASLHGASRPEQPQRVSDPNHTRSSAQQCSLSPARVDDIKK